MSTKISISLSDEDLRAVNRAVDSGDSASAGEVIREALGDWQAKWRLGRLCDDGIASGMADDGETMDHIKRAARSGEPGR